MRALIPLALAALAAGCSHANATPMPAGDAGTGHAAPPGTAAAAERPTLIVYLTVDQLRADYFDRFRGDLTGGLKRLRDEGAFFVNGFHDHAITETAPGHASTMSGRFPVHTGISMNALGVNTREAPLLGGASEIGASPFRFVGTTLTDWLKAADSRTRVLSVSRKDRGAILPIGRSVQPVFWWSGSIGGFTTSTYYGDKLPKWVEAFNAERGAAKYAGREWTLLLPAAAYPEPDSVPMEAGGQDFLFPHFYPDDTVATQRAFANYPATDSLTLAFALRGLHELQLGSAKNRVDLLAVSLSTTDAVGHRYGPDSRELHDQVVRLDRYLGAFLDSLFALRDPARVVIALTADHGVAPLPEVRSGRYPNQDAKRVELTAVWAPVRDALAARGLAEAAEFEEGNLYADLAAFKKAKVDVDSVARVLQAGIRQVPGVLRSDLITELAKADTVSDKIARRWLHMFDARGGARLLTTLTPYSYWKGVTFATHGSPHDYDAQVPVLFWGAGIVPGQHADTVRVVDMAPTLAAVARVKPTEKLDGVVLSKVLAPR